MPLIILYLSTALVFLAADAVMLSKVIKPLFEKHLGTALLDAPRVVPALVFYLFYIGGVLWFASWPAFKAGDPAIALLNGALLGAMAYGTYEFTSLAVMKDWSWQMVVVDGLWGSVLTGGAAWAGVVITRALT